MKKLRDILFVCTMAVALWALVISPACTTDECMQNKTALPYAGMYPSGSDGKQKLSVDSLEVYGYGVPHDSILSSGTSPVTALYLPFRIDHDTTTYVFRYLHKRLAAMDIADTIRFIYTRSPRFVSSACGVSYVYDIRDIQHTDMLIDSVVCPHMMIDNMDTENIRIYFKVTESE